jgi:hypothetical protein
MKKKTLLISIAGIVIAGMAAVIFVYITTLNRVQIEFDIHISKQAVYLSTYSEPPQFAIWLENPKNGDCKQVFVTNRVSAGDWEGKADVPVALPYWVAVFRKPKNGKQDRSDEEIAISGATPKDEYFRVRAEVSPGSEWICWIEMNLAGDYNEFYPQFNKITFQEDEFSCGQPALLYRTELKADAGLEYHPDIYKMSLWESGESSLAAVDNSITTAQSVFDKIDIRVIHPKPVIINLKQVEKQTVLE